MNKFFKAIVSACSKAKFEVVKHSPELLLAAGIVTSVAGVVLAVKAATDTKEDVDNYKLSKVDIQGTNQIQQENKETGEFKLVEYTDKMKSEDMLRIRTKTGIVLLKHYSPVIFVEMLSIAALIGSNTIMRRRALALAAAYTALDASFKGYRNRVIDRFGEEIDNELRHGIRRKTIEETTVNEKGKEVTGSKEVITVDDPDEYSRVFDQSNPLWVNNIDYLRMRIDSEENHVNDLLQVNKYVFLNDVLERLGFEKTKIGQVVGWTYRDGEDCYIDFDTYIDEDKCEAYLKFNVQGYILNELKEGK